MKPYPPIFALFLLFLAFPIVAQEQDVKTNDTIRTRPLELPAGIGTQNIGQPQTNTLFRPQLHPRLPTHNHRFTHRLINQTPAEIRLPANIKLNGYGHDFYNNVERTAIFSLDASPRLTLYSATTLGVHKTLLHGNISYYNIDVGGAFTLSPTVGGNAGVFYRSALQMPFPMAGAYLNMSYHATDRLRLDGGISYHNLDLQPFNMHQQSLMLNARARYQIAEDWYLNAYGGTPVLQRGAPANGMMHPMMPQPYFGGTAEYWLNQNFGIEGGVVWEQDMFGKLRPKPKFELLFK